MSKNTTAIGRGALLAKMKIAAVTKAPAAESKIVRVAKPNRAQRRAAMKGRLKVLS